MRPAARSLRAAALLLAAVLAAAPAAVTAARPAPSGQQPVVLPKPPAAESIPGRMLHIAHVNDVHNRIEETSTSSAACPDGQAASGLCLGGWARIATAVRAARAEAAREKAPFLFLDIGDEFDGTLWDIVYKGAATARLQNIVKPDAMTLGNHEFSFPAPVLAAYIKNLTAPMLGGCNVNTSAEPLLQGLIKKWIVYKAGPFKVAVLGWLTPETKYLMLNSGNVTFGEVVPSVRKCVADVKAKHPDLDLIIGMSHTGYRNDIDTAMAVPDLDIIIGSHTHTFLHSPTKTGPIFDLTKGATAADCVVKGACDDPAGLFPTIVKAKVCKAGPSGAKTCTPKEIPVVQAYFASKYMGHLKIDVLNKTLVYAQPVLLGGANSSHPVERDPAILAEIKAMEGPVKVLEAKVAGSSPVTLEAGKVARTQETNFGDYMASLLLKEGKQLPGFEAKFGPVEVGLFGGGGFRNGIDAGEVTYGDVLAAMPYGNLFAIKGVTGAQLKEGIRNGISRIHDFAGRFPQVAGIRFWHRGTDLLGVKLLKQNGSMAELDDKKMYNLASNAYILSGGDAYTMFVDQPFLYPSGDTMDVVMTNDLVAAAPKPITVPDPTKERRIINCAAAYVDCANTQLYGPCCMD